MSKSMHTDYLSVLLKTGSAFAIMITFGLGNVSAQVLPDPPDLHIGGTVPTLGSDPNLIGSSGVVNVYNNSGSAGPFSEFLLILGIPEVNGNSNSNYFGGKDPITSITAYDQQTAGPPPTFTKISTDWSSTLGGTNPYGAQPGSLGSWNSTTGYVNGKNNGTNDGTMVSGSPDAYTLLFGSGSASAGLPNSNSYTNWSGAVDTQAKFTPTGFDLYVFKIYSNDNTGLDSKGYVSIQFDNTKLLNGTFAIAFAQDTKNSYGTAFTEAGLMTNTSPGPGPLPGGNVITPAPPSAIVFSLGGVALLGFMARSRRRLLAAA
jgi:hypothetical protein